MSASLRPTPIVDAIARNRAFNSQVVEDEVHGSGFRGSAS
jgi:hypothetical protein